MNVIYFVITMVILLVSRCECFAQQNPDLVEEINVMYEEDQKTRSEVMERDMSFEEFNKKLNEIDGKNLPYVKAIIMQYGWPGYELVGEEGSDRMWLLVQHCDRDVEFQKYCLELLEEAVQKGDASKKRLAYLRDRVLVNEGNPQLYGTQMFLIDGHCELRPVEDLENLDKRRQEMGLCTIDEYFEILRQHYGK